MATVIKSETRRIADSEAFVVGDLVQTNYSGRLTKHRIKARYKARNCESGVMYEVEPQVPKSSGGKIDHAWFRRVKTNEDMA